MFVARLQRVDGDYFVMLPYDVVVQRDLRDGQIVSVVVEPIAEYAPIDATGSDSGDASWKLNDDSVTYDGDEEPDADA